MYSLIPILSYKFFPTNDGPAHLYNSMLLKNLIYNNDSFLNNYFVFNSFLIPNLTSQYLITALNTFLPINVSEKVLLIVYVIGFAYGFRNLILIIAPNNNFSTYIIFPFIYSLFLFLGFYNFILAIVLLLITLNLWIKYEYTGFNRKRVFVLFFLFLITYYSHLFSFLWLVFFVCIHLISKFLLSILHKEEEIHKLISEYLKKISVLLVISIVPIILVFYYFNLNPTFENKIYLDKVDLINFLKNIRPIVAINYTIEEAHIKKLLYLIIFLFSMIIYNKINKIEFIGNSINGKLLSFIKSFLNIKDIWLIAAAILMFLYFKLPDSDGGIGLVSVRLCYFFFIFLVIWLSIQTIPKWLGIVSAIVSIYIHFNLNQFYQKEIKLLNKTAEECYNASAFIPKNSIVLPLNWSENWLHGHFSNFIGIDKPIIILENYEATLNWFSLKWNDKQLPSMLLGDTLITNTPCFDWARTGNTNKEIKNIDYVFILGKNKSDSLFCGNKIKKIINKYYSIAYTTENCRLYKLNKNKINF
jgi:hypothetical protein